VKKKKTHLVTWKGRKSERLSLLWGGIEEREEVNITFLRRGGDTAYTETTAPSLSVELTGKEPREGIN